MGEFARFEPDAETLAAGDEDKVLEFAVRPFSAREKRCLQRRPHQPHHWPDADLVCPGVEHAILRFTGTVE